MTPADLIQQAQQLQSAGQTTQAAALYAGWLADHGEQASAAPIHFNLATLLPASDPAGKQRAYEKALALNPMLYQAAVNLGLLQENQGHVIQALATWQSALRDDLPAEGRCLLLNHLGRLQENRKNFPEAEQHLALSLQLNPRQPDVVQHYIGLRRRQCRWPSTPDWLQQARPGEDVALDIGPFMAMAELPEPERQRQSAQRFIERKLPADILALPPAPAWSHPRLRIGYFSGDFKHHAVSILMAEVLELHDRQRVQVYGLDYSDTTPTAMRQRVLRAFDHHEPLHALSDAQAAQRIRELEIDVLIDLTGLTAGSRYGVMAYRPAPVQASYLGYMGSSAIPGVDFILADRFLMPPELRPHFTEQPIYLPSYQANDRQRAIGTPPTRAECGLPAQGFVFCAFNNNYKFTPEVWARWMRILQRSPGSVLWVLQDNPQARDNLTAHAQSQGIAAERLVFAGRIAPEKYLARYHCADLFLDTSPYGAGTTASDALWAGLPVLTHPGPSMVSRMAGSLLHAAGLPELVTDSEEAYEDLAVQLATQPERLQALRQKLITQRDTCALFDTPRFVRHLEDALIATATQVRDEATRANPAHFSAPCSAPDSASDSAAEPTAVPSNPPAPLKTTHSPTAQTPHPTQHTPAPPMRLQVQGWRGIHHSYALVNQFQMLAWLDQGVSLVHTDQASPCAAIQQSGLSANDEARIQHIPADGPADAVYRIWAPLDLRTPVQRPTVTYAVTEFGLSDALRQPEDLAAYFGEGGLIHTPSHWSKDRLLAWGMPAAQVHVIPHAVHPAYFHPLQSAHITRMRQALDYQPDDVVLLNVGAHFWNKGTDLLVKAFALARAKNKHLKLLLKDQTAYTGSSTRSQVVKHLHAIGHHQPETVAAIRVMDTQLSLQQLNSLYNLADAYVTPYRAEGFNLPACEAQACGTPVIATQGGATDDFLQGNVANHFIAGALHQNTALQADLTRNAHIEPQLDALVALLENLGRKTAVTQPAATQPDRSWHPPAARLLKLLTTGA
jgi:predicted O-linked N-acetylglucosamine transferase (SPINDLY family)